MHPPTLAIPLAKSMPTVSISGTLAEEMEAAAAIGFGGVEIFENDLLTFGGSPTDVRYLAVSLGLTELRIACVREARYEQPLGHDKKIGEPE